MMTDQPTDLALERSILAQMVRDADALAHGAERIGPEAFGSRENRVLHISMRRCHQRGIRVNRDVVLSHVPPGSPPVDEVVDALAGAPELDSFGEAAKRLTEIAARRALLLAAEDVTEQAREGRHDVFEVIDGLVQRLRLIADAAQGEGRLPVTRDDEPYAELAF